VIKFAADQSFVGCDVECFSSASCVAITTHLVKTYTVAVKEVDLTNKIFFFIHNDFNLGDRLCLINIETVVVSRLCPCSARLSVVRSHSDCYEAIKTRFNLCDLQILEFFNSLCSYDCHVWKCDLACDWFSRFLSNHLLAFDKIAQDLCLLLFQFLRLFLRDFDLLNFAAIIEP